MTRVLEGAALRLARYFSFLARLLTHTATTARVPAHTPMCGAALTYPASAPRHAVQESNSAVALGKMDPCRPSSSCMICVSDVDRVETTIWPPILAFQFLSHRSIIFANFLTLYFIELLDKRYGQILSFRRKRSSWFLSLAPFSPLIVSSLILLLACYSIYPGFELLTYKFTLTTSTSPINNIYLLVSREKKV
jgi:hypothetical protein